MADAHWIGLRELRLAVARNPQRTMQEAKDFLMRGLKAYKQDIWNRPWRMGMATGGAPVARSNGGNLRDTHRTRIEGLTGTIGPTADYAPYVHGIEGWPRKRSYQLRPWLDEAKKRQRPTVERLYREMLANISKDLAK